VPWFGMISVRIIRASILLRFRASARACDQLLSPLLARTLLRRGREPGATASRVRRRGRAQREPPPDLQTSLPPRPSMQIRSSASLRRLLLVTVPTLAALSVVAQNSTPIVSVREARLSAAIRSLSTTSAARCRCRARAPSWARPESNSGAGALSGERLRLHAHAFGLDRASQARRQRQRGQRSLRDRGGDRWRSRLPSVPWAATSTA
jgi:hypothetical protein